jgi:hypothetical protein
MISPKIQRLEISSDFSITKNSRNRVPRNNLGTNIYKYINEKRLEQNNQLLLENNFKSIKLTKSVVDLHNKTHKFDFLVSPRGQISNHKFKAIDLNKSKQRVQNLNSDILSNMDRNSIFLLIF